MRSLQSIPFPRRAAASFNTVVHMTKMKASLLRLILILMSITVLSGTEREIADDILLYGAARGASAVEHLKAGPVRLNFCDGELRHLYVGNKEIIRRIYISVRDTHWDTVDPIVEIARMEKYEASFSIRLRGSCRVKGIDYIWQGDIEGTADGKISFAVLGRANSDALANRFGMCVLYGSESLAGQKYEVFDRSGKTRPGFFPVLLDQIILNDKFESLRYETLEGLVVDTRVKNSVFGMEDQRQFGDRSYKAFSAMNHSYPRIKKGDSESESITIQVRQNRANTTKTTKPSEADAPIVVRVGNLLPGRKVPKILPFDEKMVVPGFFMNLANSREKLLNASLVAWPFNVAVNLFDDENVMENLGAVEDQIRTARSWAPGAILRVSPASFNAPYARADRDARNRDQFAVSWMTALMAHLAHAGADEIMVDIGPGSVDQIGKIFRILYGQPVLSTTVEAFGECPLAVLALQFHGSTIAWVANATAKSRRVNLEGLNPINNLEVWRANARAQPSAGQNRTQTQAVDNGRTHLNLAPFEVCLAGANIQSILDAADREH